MLTPSTKIFKKCQSITHSRRNLVHQSSISSSKERAPSHKPSCNVTNIVEQPLQICGYLADTNQDKGWWIKLSSNPQTLTPNCKSSFTATSTGACWATMADYKTTCRFFLHLNHSMLPTILLCHNNLLLFAEALRSLLIWNITWNSFFWNTKQAGGL